MFETCLILAGGRGSRLGKLTAKTPKPLVKVGETQFIYYLIEHLISHGISNIILLTGYKSEQFDSVKSYYSTRRGVSIRCKATNEDWNTLQRVYNSIEDISGDTLVCYGDVYTDVDITDYYKFFKSCGSKQASISALSRHTKISASELYNEEHQAKLIYKDVGFHAFEARWLKDKLVQAKDVKFEKWFWDNSDQHTVYNDDWIYGSLTDEYSLRELEGQFTEKATLIMDRDGVINKSGEKGSFVDSLEKLELQESVKNLIIKNEKYIERIIVATNQPWIDNNKQNSEKHNKIKDKVVSWLAETKIPIHYLHCPHKYEERCECRKPKTGMIKKFLLYQTFMRRKTVVVGDQMSDAQLAQLLGDVSFVSVELNSASCWEQSFEKAVKSKINSDHRYYRLCGFPHGRFDYK